MAEQTLGNYAFEDDPEKMGIPESKKTVAVVDTYTSVAVFQWPALIAGRHIDLLWTLMSDTMYAALRALYVSDAVVTWIPRPATLAAAGASYQVAVIGLEGVYNEATFHHQPYRFDVKLSLLILSESEIAKLEPPPS
jgi:hypothetical protein